MPSALLLPLLTCSVVLLVSGAAKLRDHASVDAAFTSMRVPAPLDAGWVRRVLPWGELALGLWLLVATGPALVAVAFVVLVLFLVYLGLVLRALVGPDPADCGCFGALGDSRVTTVTAWRNGLLVLAAALTLVAGFRDVSVLGDIRVDGVWAWLVAAALAVAVAVLVTWRSPAEAGDSVSVATTTDADGEYVRRAIPDVQVQSRDGSLVLLGPEAARAAHLLVFLSPGCGPCQSIAPDLAGWREQLAPVVRVRSVLSATPAMADLKPEFAEGWFDPHGFARKAFGVGNPGAVLLGTDGELAGGPVNGEADVRAFVDEVVDHLREAREAAADAPAAELEAVSDDR